LSSLRPTSDIRITFSLLTFSFALWLGAANAQPLLHVNQTFDHFQISKPETAVQLSHDLIIPNSESVYLDSSKLKRGVDYLIENSTGRITLKLKREIDFRSSKIIIYIQYNFLPFSFQPFYRHKNFSIHRDSINHRATVVATNVSPLSDIFGNELQKSGSIFRGFSVGSNRDLTLNSGFRLQFAGKLSSDVEILAALTDENTPIQPEGNTQTLQELDKVFVEIKGTNYEATLGDFYLDLVGSDFGR
jgi:hypothetical protein